MNIQYKKNRLRNYVIFGGLWLAVTIVQVAVAKNNYWLFTWLVVGFFNIAQFVHMYRTPYLTIKEDLLILNNFMDEKSIKLSESIKIKESNGEYIIETDRKKLKINTNVIELTSLDALNAELRKYNLI
ncbi:MAG: hypothetical protein JXQ96_08710 [Cyclobacteriaceae bacterium]